VETTIEEDYISIISILKGLWSKRRKLLKIILVFFVIGLFIAIFSPKEYTSGVKFLSNTSSIAKVSGKWSGIAALVGVNLNTGTENNEIAPNIYPKIINSIPFQKNLMETKLNFKGADSAITFEDYYIGVAETDLVTNTKKYTINLPSTIINLFGEKKVDRRNILLIDSLEFLSIDQQKLSRVLKNNLSFAIDETDGVISISATMPEAIPAAQLAQRAQVLLQKEIISYRTAKAIDQMNFIVEQFDTLKLVYEENQYKFARFKDRNQFNITQMSQIEFQKIQAEYELSYTLFSELERQKAAQEIQVRKDTPIFTTINPAAVPLDPSKPNRIKIVLTYLIMGFFFAVFYGLGIEFYKKIKTAWIKN
jgi:hypothetical protein